MILAVEQLDIYRDGEFEGTSYFEIEERTEHCCREMEILSWECGVNDNANYFYENDGGVIFLTECPFCSKPIDIKIKKHVKKDYIKERKLLDMPVYETKIRTEIEILKDED